MKNGRRVLAVVPARGGDDEVPYLNIKKLGPLPLIAHTLLEAGKSRYVDRIIVSTDDDHVARVAEEYGAEVPFRRPEALARDIPLLKPVIAHAVETLEAQGERFDIVVTLQATSPFRSARQIDEAVDKLVAEGFDAVISVQEHRGLSWKREEGRLEPLFAKAGRREELEPFYQEDGAIRVIRRAVLESSERLGRRVGEIVLDKMSGVTVHDIYDFWLAERLVRLPRVLFRVDGGGDMGMGHVYRSVAVAEALRSISHADICFLMRADLAEGVVRVSSSGHQVRVLPGAESNRLQNIVETIRDYSPNIIVNDQPYLEGEYLDALSKLGASTINLVDSVNDIENPETIASVIISTMQEEQLDLDELYAGPAFAILRESFERRASIETTVPDRGKRIVVSFGGSDPQALTLKVLRALDGLERDEEAPLSVSAVLGPAFSYRRELDLLLPALSPRPEVLQNVEHMAEVLSEADLVFCSGGMTVFEIAALGVPGIVLCQNAREQERMERFSRFGTIWHLGLGPEVSEEVLRRSARDLLTDPERRRVMSEAGSRLVDARGASRVAEVVMKSRARGPAAGGKKG